MDDFEVLIVGQGVAGTMLAHELDRSKVNYKVIDKGHHTSCTAAAAGIMNPLTGRRFTIASGFSRLKQKALQSYRILEEELQVKLVYPLPMENLFYDEEQKSRWLKKRDDPHFMSFLGNMDNVSYTEHLVYPDCIFSDLITESLAIDLKTLITSFRKKLFKEKRLIQENFNVNELIYRSKGFEWNGLRFEKIVFCQGSALLDNPIFKSSLIKPSKGQALIGRFTGELPQRIIKGKVFIVPYPSLNAHWVGSWNQWQYSGNQPEDRGVEIILKKLAETLDMEFKIIETVAGVRPATKDRNPIIGIHPDHPGIYCFNGLGTKGSSLAPYWAEKTAEHILYGVELPDTVNISRF